MNPFRKPVVLVVSAIALVAVCFAINPLLGCLSVIAVGLGAFFAHVSKQIS